MTPGQQTTASPYDQTEPLQGPDGVQGELREEYVMSIVKTMLITVPNITRHPWLATPEEDLGEFVHELTIYCRNHDLDPNEYFGDWLPLAITGAGIGAGIVARHREHKKSGGEDEVIDDKEFDSTTGFSEPYTPVEEKKSEYDEGEGGDNLPDDEQKEEMEVEDDRHSTETALACIETAAPEEPEY